MSPYPFDLKVLLCNTFSVQSRLIRSKYKAKVDHPSLALALDPRKTWEAFILNSERQKTIRRRKNRRRNRKLPMPKEGPAGPPGPRGPPGPPGQDGGTLSTQEMEEYIRDYIRDYLDAHNDTRRLNEVVENRSAEVSKRGRVRVAFSATLPQSPTIKPSELTIIDSFTITFSPGLVSRRVVAENGGFAVTKNGLYQVAASLVLHPKGMSNTALIPKNEISVYICVNNCNKNNRVLEWAGSIGEGTVTAVLTGHIMVSRGDALFIAIDNTS
ncbi:hypothetical protein SK128_014626, partial [Halocaridina rubra]